MYAIIEIGIIIAVNNNTDLTQNGLNELAASFCPKIEAALGYKRVFNRVGITVNALISNLERVYSPIFCLPKYAAEEFYKLKYCSTVVYMVPRA